MKQYHDLVNYVLKNGVQKATEQEPEQKCFWLSNAI
jgi:hypothetical protein